MEEANEKRLPFYRVLLDSRVLKREVENIILLPDNYDKAREYPVLYLLVGADNAIDSWVTMTNLCRYAAEFDMIIVTPNNGWQSRQSWYLDSNVLENSAYETFVSYELIEFINRNYSVIDDRNGRAISGISMGGHGALTLASKHPGLFCSVSAFMGIMDLETWKLKGSWLYESISGVLGDYESNSALWRENSAMNLIERLVQKEIKIKFSCGTEDTVEKGWGAYPDNERLHMKMEELKIAHEYFSFPGSHCYEAVDCYLKEYLEFHYKSFRLQD